MLILDEPTNHLDVDAREALVQALNDYGGTVILVSHDRHMVELTADRLVLVDHGTATEYAGSLDDYTDMILGKNGEAAATGDGAGSKQNKKEARRAAAEAREQGQALRKAAKAAEAEMAKLDARRTALDRAMFDPASASAEDSKRTMSELMKLRAEVSAKLEAAEAQWLSASEALESLAA